MVVVSCCIVVCDKASSMAESTATVRLFGPLRELAGGADECVLSVRMSTADHVRQLPMRAVWLALRHLWDGPAAVATESPSNEPFTQLTIQRSDGDATVRLSAAVPAAAKPSLPRSSAAFRARWKNILDTSVLAVDQRYVPRECYVAASDNDEAGPHRLVLSGDDWDRMIGRGGVPVELNRPAADSMMLHVKWVTLAVQEDVSAVAVGKRPRTASVDDGGEAADGRPSLRPRLPSPPEIAVIPPISGG